MQDFEITDLTSDFLDKFFVLFSDVMENDYKYYSSEQKSLFLQEMYSKEKIESMIENDFYKILVATHDEEIIGFLCADAGFGGVGFITWLGVNESSRHKGIGSELIVEYEKFLKSQDAHLIEAFTTPNVQEFYENLGFKHIGTRKKGYFQIPNVIMDKEI